MIHLVKQHVAIYWCLAINLKTISMRDSCELPKFNTDKIELIFQQNSRGATAPPPQAKDLWELVTTYISQLSCMIYKQVSLSGRGVARNGLRRGFWGQKLSKEGVLRVRKHCGYVPERRFVCIKVKITKKLGQWGGRFWPPYPHPLATPLL